ncbi:HdaA/DnaA family protein [Rhizorhapis sp.]|uniref:HdaA/DnaA family protein n=1 Tax=Rhizorhapis sp. TaxID=1968842 RepID=UPI002B49AC68|nr:chromosomal replication initiator DnaA [Rhizorhapis sp.]HKR18040.1 chromosomal replication initiator DnaA [Rhizorhapis sp.]
MSQISLPLDWTSRDKGETFLLSESNRLAVRHLDHWGIWPVRISILTGPTKSGRSTLGRLFVRKTGGKMIDDARQADEEALFHAWNNAQMGHYPLLLIADLPPAMWDIALPDLRSRLAAAPHVSIEEPDDALALALLEKGLADCGAAYSVDLAAFLHRRIERSYAAIAATVACLNDAALSQSRKISVPFAKEVLHKSGLGDI